MWLKKASSFTAHPAKILFIEANLDGTIGGSHYCLLEIVKFIDRTKYHPTVLFYENNELKPEFEKISRVYVFNRNNRLNFRRSYPGHLLRIPLIFSLLMLFQKCANIFFFTIPDFIRELLFLRREDIYLVHMNNAPYLCDWLLACKLLGIKCTAHLRGNWEPGWLRKKLLKYYDGVIAISNSVKDYIVKKGIAIDNFVVINDGIDTNLPKTVLPLTREGLATTLQLQKRFECVIGLVGNIKPWKGQDVLIDAINVLKMAHPYIKCLIIGDVSRMTEDMEYFRRLKGMVQQYKLEDHVIFTGFRKDILEIVSCLDVLVHTSIDPEPFGRVILEGMLLSKPVIATAHGGPLDIIENGVSGYLVPANDSETLAETLSLLLSDASLREKVGRQAKLRVEQRFSLEKQIREIEKFYYQVITQANII